MIEQQQHQQHSRARYVLIMTHHSHYFNCKSIIMKWIIAWLVCLCLKIMMKKTKDLQEIIIYIIVKRDFLLCGYYIMHCASSNKVISFFCSINSQEEG